MASAPGLRVRASAGAASFSAGAGAGPASGGATNVASCGLSPSMRRVSVRSAVSPGLSSPKSSAAGDATNAGLTTLAVTGSSVFPSGVSMVSVARIVVVGRSGGAESASLTSVGFGPTGAAAGATARRGSDTAERAISAPRGSRRIERVASAREPLSRAPRSMAFLSSTSLGRRTSTRTGIAALSYLPARSSWPR